MEVSELNELKYRDVLSVSEFAFLQHINNRSVASTELNNFKRHLEMQGCELRCDRKGYISLYDYCDVLGISAEDYRAKFY